MHGSRVYGAWPLSILLLRVREMFIINCFSNVAGQISNIDPRIMLFTRPFDLYQVENCPVSLTFGGDHFPHLHSVAPLCIYLDSYATLPAYNRGIRT